MAICVIERGCNAILSICQELVRAPQSWNAWKSPGVLPGPKETNTGNHDSCVLVPVLADFLRRLGELPDWSWILGCTLWGTVFACFVIERVGLVCF